MLSRKCSISYHIYLCYTSMALPDRFFIRKYLKLGKKNIFFTAFPFFSVGRSHKASYSHRFVRKFIGLFFQVVIRKVIKSLSHFPCFHMYNKAIIMIESESVYVCGIQKYNLPFLYCHLAPQFFFFFVLGRDICWICDFCWEKIMPDSFFHLSIFVYEDSQFIQ